MMNKTTEALKMAIEALQNNQTYDWKGNPLTALDEANEKVINACKEALKEDALEPVAYRYKVSVEDNHWTYNFCQYPDDKNNPKLEPLYTHPAPKPAQEYDINELIDKITPENLQEPVAEVTSKTGADITMSWWHEPALPVGTKLYTHPAQPLSDDEKQRFARDWDSRMELVDAIEAKIKEKNHG